MAVRVLLSCGLNEAVWDCGLERLREARQRVVEWGYEVQAGRVRQRSEGALPWCGVTTLGARTRGAAAGLEALRGAGCRVREWCDGAVRCRLVGRDSMGL